MFTNIVRAKISTHTLLVVLGALAFAAHRFFADPNAAAWLNAHWALKDLGETAGAVLVAYGVYASPTKPAA